MFDKNIRILIVEPNETQAICVDKMLNRMGYYCVASTRTLIEGLILNSYGLRKFDALILPEHMIRPTPGKASSGTIFNINNLFVYACDSSSTRIDPKNKGVLRTHTGLPEYPALEEFMTCVVRNHSLSLAKTA
ncbi:hypothetical protein ACKJSM_07550 [Pseudomonas sp. PHC1]|uniref:hypothetical protein n=1 Tax=Pseudomonas sp. PHC1 TaxID=3384759 RepID=UPI00396F4A14